MRIFPAPMEIGENDGFTDANDIFGYREFGERLGNLVCAVDHPLTLLLDGPWGSGKSTFIKQWAGHLRKQGVPVIHFDAFANDYHEDPFLALAGEILARAKGAHASQGAVFKKKAAAVGKVVLKHGATFAMRVATLGAIGAAELGETVEEVAKAAADGSGDLVQEFLERQLEKHGDETQTLADFRETLGALAATLASEGQKEKNRPLVVIVDELDRCKPLFAVNLLERVKHLFSVQRVVFVLVTNLEQIAAATEGVYGAGTDGKAYLDKFYDLRITLPISMSVKYDRVSQFIANQWHTMGLHNGGVEPDLIQVLAKLKGIELRGVSRILTHVALLQGSLPKRSDASFTSVITHPLCVLRHVDRNMYEDARTGMLSYSQIEKFLMFQSWPDDHLREFTSAVWMYCLRGDVGGEIQWQSEIKRAMGMGVKHSTIVPGLCRVLDNLANIT